MYINHHKSIIFIIFTICKILTADTIYANIRTDHPENCKNLLFLSQSPITAWNATYDIRKVINAYAVKNKRI